MATCRASTIGQLKNEIELHFRNLSQEMVERQKRVTRLWQTMADACFAFSVQTGEKKTELRLHASREIILQYSASLERTAPWWAKPGRYVIRIAQSTKDWVTDKASLLKPMGWLESKSKETIDFVQGKIRRGEIGKVVSANTLSDALQNSDLRNDLATSDEELDRRSQSMINRFQIESRTRLDDGQVDRFTSEIWGQMGWKSRLWHGLMPATLAFAPLLAVIAIPIDFGGSSVLVLASMKELFVAGFLGAGLALWNKDGMPKIAEENAAWQQLSDLFAIGCDQLGLPRPESNQFPTIHLGAVRKQLSLSSVACPSPKCEPIRPLPIELNPSFLEQVRSMLHQLQQEVTG